MGWGVAEGKGLFDSLLSSDFGFYQVRVPTGMHDCTSVFILLFSFVSEAQYLCFVFLYVINDFR